MTGAGTPAVEEGACSGPWGSRRAWPVGCRQGGQHVASIYVKRTGKVSNLNPELEVS